MLLQHVTMEILINMLAAILNFVGFAGEKASKRLVTLAVSIPAHHKMAQIKGELVLKSIDIIDYVATSCYHGDIDQKGGGHLEIRLFWWQNASKMLM